MPKDPQGDALDPRFDDTCFPAIGDYGLIGDGRICALVSTYGSIDWLCLPNVSSPSIFAALLDRREGGRFAIRPTRPFRVRRQYDDATVILHTEFTTDTGRCRLIDLIPVTSPGRHVGDPEPEREVLRLVEGIEGEVEMEMIFTPRPQYGRFKPEIRKRGKLGWCASHGIDFINLISDVEPLEEHDGDGLTVRFLVRKGDRKGFSLVYENRGPGVIAPLGAEGWRRHARTREFWTEWSGRMDYDGPHRDLVQRSVLTLKLLTYVLSGAVLAAATSSLPESMAGGRNYDYRFCWLRDAGITLRGFSDLGYSEEGAAFMDWLMHSTRLTQPRLQVCYDVYGKTNLNEWEVEHLSGWRGVKPVHMGNAAAGQFQLDIYGEVVMAAYDYVLRGGRLDAFERKLLLGFGKVVCDRWRDPDAGIWELRGDYRQNTHSKLMAWVALDRLMKMCGDGALDAPASDYRDACEGIREMIETRAWNERVQGYTAVLDGDKADASVLLMAHYGFHEADHPRMTATYDFLRRRLGAGPFLYRLEELREAENAFLLCSFWEIGYLARAGRCREAEDLFDRLAACANDLGLFAEEINPETGEMMGNFPQAFSHVGLIDGALALAAIERNEEAPE